MKLMVTLFSLFAISTSFASVDFPFAVHKMIGIGIQADLNPAGELIIQGVVPGGPAEVDGTIKKGDQILHVKSNSNAKWVEIAGMKMADIGALFKGNKGEAIGLKMSRNNKGYELELVRDEFEFETEDEE